MVPGMRAYHTAISLTTRRDVNEAGANSAGLTERRVRDDVEPLITDRAVALDAYSVAAFRHPSEGGFNCDKLLLPGLSQLLQNLVVIAFDRTIIVIPVGRSLKVVFDLFKARRQLLLALEKYRPILCFAPLPILR